MAVTILEASEAVPPAGGAGFDEILIAGAIATVVIAFFGWVVLMERLDRPTFVSRLADWVAKLSKLPRWVGLPVLLGLGSILLAGWGVWWDVPIHMQNGRDEGPLANPSHYPIFLGILGFTHSGILAMGLARDPLPRHTFRLAPNWRVPMGSLIITGAGLIALIGFPADDLWHRLFGQDVTEWGPTHVMMIGGAVTFVLGFPVLLAEAAQVAKRSGLVQKVLLDRIVIGIALATCGIPFAFLMEFDLGVPQFPAATQFLIFAFLMAWICVAVRLWIGPGGALLAAALYLVAHAILWVSIWALPEVLTARFLLAVPSAIIVELLALVIQPKRKNRPLVFGITAGLLVGSLGMYAEWWWSKWFMPLPQPFNADSLPFLLSISTAAGVGGGLMAVWLVSRVRLIGDPEPPAPGKVPFRGVGLVGLAIFVGLMAAYAVPNEQAPHTGVIEYSDVSTGGSECDHEELCLAHVTVQFTDGDPAADAIWFYGLAWQGRPKGSGPDVPRDPEADVPGIVRTAMEPTGVAGQYRSEHPLPLYGNWKTLLRLHIAPRELVSFALYAPDDPAIKGSQGRQVSVANGAEVETVLERKFLQREQREDVPKWMFGVGYAIVIASWLALLLFYGWCYNRAAAPVREEATESTTGGSA